MTILDNFHFLRPVWLFALLPALVTWYALLRAQEPGTAWKKLIAPHLLKHLLTGQKKRKKIRPIHILAIIWPLMITALAGPTWKKEKTPFSEDTAQMIVLLKIHPTMMAKDIAPSRLTRAKQKLYDLLKIRKNAATALVVYSGTAHLVMPATKDSNIINIMAQGIIPKTMPVRGDSLDKALTKATELLKDSKKTGSILIMADSVSGNQPELIEKNKKNWPYPVQILAMNTKIDENLKKVTASLDAHIEQVSIDNRDVKNLHQQAKREMQNRIDTENGQYWKDFGYYLLFPVLLLAMFWMRPGFKIAT